MPRSLGHRMALLALVFLTVPAATLPAQEAAEAPPPELEAAPGLTIRVDPRVELLGIVFRLAGHPEYNRAVVKPYVDAVETQFGPFRDHAVVRRARELRASRGVSYDACMSFAVHLTDDGTLQERVPFDPRPDGLDSRWTPAEARAFLQDLQAFAAESKFAEFYDRERPLYDVAVSRMKALLDRDAHLEWFPAFFGARPGSRFAVALAMLNGPSNYGPHVRLSEDAEELHAILGVWAVDPEGQPLFGTGVVETLVHEFCHSYANPVVDRHEAALRPAGEKLYAPVAVAMQRQAYGDWTTMMRETVVRACTLRYISRYQGPVAVVRRTLDELNRSFRSAGPLATFLADEYEPHRDRYPTLESFAPRLIAFFEEQAAAAPQVEAPRIVKVSPADGAMGVDPTLDRIEVVFDRPMRDESWSLVGGPPELPELRGTPSYDAARKTWSVGVRLQPERSYVLRFNSPRFRAFQSAEGIPLEPVLVKFRTGPAASR